MANNKTRGRSSLTPGEKLLFLAGILFSLVLITTAMMGGLFARYTTKDSGHDGARVATFGNLTLTESPAPFENNTWRFQPGVDLTKKATVTFDASEVAVYVFLKIDLSGHWETTDHKIFTLSQDGTTVMTWELEEEWNHLDGTVYYIALDPNTPLTMDIIADDGKITVNENATKANLAALTGTITVDFQATAVQAGGFDGPAQAWASVSN